MGEQIWRRAKGDWGYDPNPARPREGENRFSHDDFANLLADRLVEGGVDPKAMQKAGEAILGRKVRLDKYSMTVDWDRLKW